MPEADFTVVIPCFNEEAAIADTIDELVGSTGDQREFEIIVVDDGSTDRSGEILAELQLNVPQLRVIQHPHNRGYGAALKTGIRQALTELVVITDADGTYPNDRIPELVRLARNNRTDMLVGARIGKDVNYSKLRAIPKFFLKAWVRFLVDFPVPDINSGLRVFRREAVTQYLKVLPNSFSFTTTITIAMLRSGHNVHYEPIRYNPRVGQSKIKPIRDTIRFSQLILRTGMYFASIRALAPVILVLGICFLASMINDVVIAKNLTDKTILLLMFTLNTGLFALLADMIEKRCGL